MPKCGSQIILCDLPVRFDTYEGCGHACRYCFVKRKNDISKIKNGEKAESLRAFINGNRTRDLKWLDWDIPLHFGGMSDPFQPIERTEQKTLEALKVFAQTQYPFVVSTKNKLIAEDPYLSLIKQCNCVVQISAACPVYDEIEKGASTFAERMEAAAKISPYKRVIIRVQPYLPNFHEEITEALKTFAEIGVYGITVEGMKYLRAMPNTLKVGNDNLYPAKLLRQKYTQLRDECHTLGMRFYCAENRLRSMGDDLCCCGIDGLGWKTNKGNLVHLLNGDAEFSEGQKINATGFACGINQKSISGIYDKQVSFEECMQDAFQVRKIMRVLIPES